MGWKIESGVGCPWESDSSPGFTPHPLAFFASPCGSLNDFSRHASSVPGLSALCRLEHAGISKQWNLWAEIEFITTLPAQITSLNGAAIRAMGFDFQVFYWSTFWISPPVCNYSLSPTLHLCSIQTSDLMVWQCTCLDVWMSVCLHAFAEAWLALCSRKWQLLVHDHLFTRLHPPLPSSHAHINPVSISQPQPLFSVGGLRHTTGGCKTCLWGLLTVPSLQQLARMDWPSLIGLCWVWRSHLVMHSLSVSLIVSFFCLCIFPVQDFFSWLSSPCPAASCSLPTSEDAYLAI